MSVWSTLYRGREEVNGVQFDDMVAYVIVNAIIGGLIYSEIHTNIGKRIVDGSISLDFIKPVNFKAYMFSIQLGENLFRIIFNIVPACLFVIFIWGFTLPETPHQMILFLFALINGVILFFYFNFILGLLVFWFHSPFFVDWVTKAFFQLFAGTVVPLWFYPEFLYKISLFLPFRLITYEPITIYVGQTSLAESWWIIFQQFIWIIVFYLLNKWFWNKSQTIVNIHGG
ncbi:ABC-2 family transporter protein [Evansella sp. AB-P1]|uniref:ABC transporter permease n=1 Tax=Evansella sp. AB-P1 TaxID=3037653 RepID=UPI00241F99F4|nr:ABC-2 family transporter protein [Evansella sp. AB-P1]MDG5788609.1 ABC-2 family transporter protein [Evansella sp. AB-P1]